MTNYETLKNMTIDELTEWLDEYAEFSGSPWLTWFDKTYCQKCEPETDYVPYLDKNMEFSWCELNNDKCKFFPCADEVPNNKQIIRLWLECDAGSLNWCEKEIVRVDDEQM